MPSDEQLYISVATRNTVDRPNCAHFCCCGKIWLRILQRLQREVRETLLGILGSLLWDSYLSQLRGWQTSFFSNSRVEK